MMLDYVDDQLAVNRRWVHKMAHNVGDNGYDTGPFKTVITRGWMSELGIKKHYVDKDGPFAIEL
jgi:hypothetical protein